MNRRQRALIALWMGSATFAAAQAPIPALHGFRDGSDFTSTSRIAPGIVHRFDSFTTGPLTINTVWFDLKEQTLEFEGEKGRDDMHRYETVPQLVERNADPAARPLVAMNADFYDGKAVMIGPFVDEGTIWKGPWFVPSGPRSVVAFDNIGNVFIGRPKLTFAISGPGQALTIDRVNFSEDPLHTVAYTWPIGDEPPAVPQGKTQIILDLTTSDEWLPNAPASVTVRSTTDQATVRMTRRTVVLHTPAPAPLWIKQGARLKLHADFDQLPGKVTAMVGGMPRLIENGRTDAIAYAIEEGAGKTFSTDLHPRTAIGLLKGRRTMVWVTVDGRQSTRSIGISLPDLATYMKNLGCVDAINLDGGGSTTMVVAGDLVNFPSDAGGPRSVANSIVARRRATLGRPALLALHPRDVNVPLGGRFDFLMSFADAAGERIPYAAIPTTRNMPPGGHFSRFQVPTEFTAVGRQTITGGFSIPGSERLAATTTVDVRPVARIEAEPESLMMRSGEPEPLGVQTYDPQGKPLLPAAQPGRVKTDLFTDFDPTTGIVTPKSKGVGGIDLEFGDKKLRVPVAVDSVAETMLFNFDALPANPLSGENYDTATSSLTLVQDPAPKEGSGAVALTYSMSRGGGASRLWVPVGARLPVGTRALALWTYGDGSGHYYRAEITDATGTKWLVELTTGNGGVDWKDEWRDLHAPLGRARRLSGPGTELTLPATLTRITLMQPQEAAKTNGRIVLDGLRALSFPTAP